MKKEDTDPLPNFNIHVDIICHAWTVGKEFLSNGQNEAAESIWCAGLELSAKSFEVHVQQNLYEKESDHHYILFGQKIYDDSFGYTEL